MPYTFTARNLMLNALIGTNPTVPVTHAGLQTKQAGKAVTGIAATDIFTATAHGYAAGDLAVFSGLTGGTGIIPNRPYFVIANNLTANTFQVSTAPGGATIDFTTDLTAGTVNRLVEVSGGAPAYARIPVVFVAAAGAVVDDPTSRVFNIPAGGQVDYVSYHNGLTAGTLLSIASIPVEAYTGQGTFTITDGKLDLLLVSGGTE